MALSVDLDVAHIFDKDIRIALEPIRFNLMQDVSIRYKRCLQ
jgi:hypothetical protein